MKRYRLRLAVRYSYSRPGGGGRQLLRVLPASIPGRQRVDSAVLSVTPTPVERRVFSDFFGTRVTEVVLPPGLTELAVEMSAQVRCEEPEGGFDLSDPLPALASDIAAVHDVGRDSPHHFLAPSPRIPTVPEIAAFAAGATAGAATAQAAVAALGEALHAALTFNAEATDVDTPVAEAFAGRHGVCQDFSQIMIAGLRSLGIPAAYVSGYLRTLPPPGRPRLEGADAMHAWVRAWTGAESGWTEYDPTNACFVATDHLAVGFGRDYGDAAPVVGMLRLDGAQRGSHTVDLEEV